MALNKILFSSIVLILAVLFLNYYSNIDYSCTNYWSYLRVTSNPNCYYNPDARSDTLSIIKRHTKLGEKHQVQTEDGYILTLFRIPQKSPKGTILLQHCLLCDSTIWVAQQNDSVAFFFWRRNYDVWLGNFRGNFYSKNHRTLSKNDPKFWNYTLTEMGYLDNKATIDYILQKTNGRKIIYLGYSMGGTVGLVYASTRAEEARKNLKVVAAIGSPTLSKHGTSWFYPADFSTYTKVYSFGGFDVWYTRLFRAFHGVMSLKKWFVYGSAFLNGWSIEEFDPRYVNDIVAHYGSEVSLKTIKHFAQLAEPDSNFPKFNYGKNENLVVYGLEKSPNFPLSKIKVPILLISGTNDTITPVEDQRLLEIQLPDQAKILRPIDVEGFSHVDFLFGKRRNQEVFEKILQKIDEI